MDTKQALEILRKAEQGSGFYGILSSVSWDIAALIEQLNTDNARMRTALEVARHALVTSHNLLATDRPDLVHDNNNIMWMTDNTAGIDAIDQALSTPAQRGRE